MSWPEKTAPTTDASEKVTIGKGIFRKCDGCSTTMDAADLAARFEVCPSCHHHHRLSARSWRDLLVDAGTFEEWSPGLESVDALGFTDGISYVDRLAAAKKKTSFKDSVEIGGAKLGGRAIAWGSFVFSFMGGSMGSVAGEKITRLFEEATSRKLPVVLLQASGGARMQEGILSLMQMAKSVAALERFRAVRLPFLSVLLDPTTGGVAASFAFLGDVNIGEPGAQIGFAGARVIENTLRQTLPRGFQRSEFLLDHGMLDLIMPRLEMKAGLSQILHHLCGANIPAPA